MTKETAMTKGGWLSSWVSPLTMFGWVSLQGGGSEALPSEGAGVVDIANFDHPLISGKGTGGVPLVAEQREGGISIFWSPA